MTTLIIIMSTKVWCDPEVQLHHLQPVTGTRVLGRCITCCKNKRGAEYCRLVQQHKAPQATTCDECQQNKGSVTKCRQELHHEGDNAFYIDEVTFTGSEIPPCCLELHGLHTLCCSSRSGELKKPYVTRYMVPYTYSKWACWLKTFTLQTGCEYRQRSQKQKQCSVTGDRSHTNPK